jgi:RNA polymerase sigma-70 factor (ECF subfamily)
VLLRTQPPPVGIATTDSRTEIWDAVRQLPQRQRTAVALRYVADMTEQSIADVMDVRVGTVSATLHAARRRLADLLGDDAMAEGRDVNG